MSHFWNFSKYKKGRRNSLWGRKIIINNKKNNSEKIKRKWKLQITTLISLSTLNTVVAEVIARSLTA